MNPLQSVLEREPTEVDRHESKYDVYCSFFKFKDVTTH